MKFHFNFYLFFLLFLCACSYRVEHNQSSIDDVFISQELIAKISYAEVKRVVFDPSCISCHGESGNVNLENFENTRAHLAEIKNSTLLSKNMPKAPYSALNQTQLQYLSAWYKAGTPQFAADPTPPTKPIVLLPTFASIKENIISKKCLSCHNPNGDAERVPLDTVEAMINSPLDIIIPSNADESGFIIVIKEGARGKMPPPRSGIKSVSAEEIEIIKEWINNGAKD
jgi:uncharacterized membrane protein